MSHEWVDGYTVRVPAWHHGETNHKVLSDYPGREQAIIEAGHNWTVKENVLQLSDGKAVAGWRALSRSDTGQILFCGQGILQADSKRSAMGYCRCNRQSAGRQVRYGRRFCGGLYPLVLALLDEPWKVPGDDSATFPYIMATTAHDGTHATSAMGMSVRVVCWNTHQLATREAQRKGLYYSFRHTANVQERLNEAKEALTTVRETFNLYRS